MLKTPRSVHREREEREEAEREGRQMVEEELEDENIPSPFQPISSVISEVCVCVCVTSVCRHRGTWCCRLLVSAKVYVKKNVVKIDSFLLSEG